MCKGRTVVLSSGGALLISPRLLGSLRGPQDLHPWTGHLCAVLVPGWSDLLPTPRLLKLGKFKRRGESRIQVYCRKFGKNCSTKGKSKMIKGHIHLRVYSPNRLAALSPERPYNSRCHQPRRRGFWSMSRPHMGLWFFYTFAFLLCKKVALHCFRLHYLVTFKFARIFIFCEHWYFFYWAKPVKDFALLGVYLFLMKFLKLFMYGLSCMVPILLF